MLFCLLSRLQLILARAAHAFAGHLHAFLSGLNGTIDVECRLNHRAEAISCLNTSARTECQGKGSLR